MDRNYRSAIENQYSAEVALRKESVDRNGKRRVRRYVKRLSLSARRAWIEIQVAPVGLNLVGVALRKESVDRNADVVSVQYGCQVALRKESVDRNVLILRLGAPVIVALRKESVDRNI